MISCIYHKQKIQIKGRLVFYILFLFIGCGLACQQEIKFVLAEAQPIHYQAIDEQCIQQLHCVVGYIIIIMPNDRM